MEVDGGALVAVDLHTGEVGQPGNIAAIGRGTGIGTNRGRTEAAAEDEIDHLLIGAIAIFERDFLGQDIDPLDRLGRDIAELTKAGDAQAVEQQHRLPGTATARTADLRGDGLQQFGDAGRAGGADVAAVQLILGRDVADHRGAFALADDDDRFLLRLFVGGGGHTASIICGLLRDGRDGG